MRPSKPLPERKGTISPEEIREVMADEGYSAGDRKGWLKEVLTELSSEPEGAHTPETERLIEEIKETIDQNQKRRSIAEDSM